MAGKFYFTGKPCKHGHISKRLSSSGTCYECHKIRTKSWRDRNKEKMNDLVRAWRSKNPERTRELRRNNAHKNRHTQKKWIEDNRDLSRFYANKRRALKQSATPVWLTDEQEEQIKAIYQHARDCEVVSGERYDVDHVIPLQGKSVCGLHVPWNLQVLPKDVNIKKGNRYEYDQCFE